MQGNAGEKRWQRDSVLEVRSPPREQGREGLCGRLAVELMRSSCCVVLCCAVMC